MNEETRQKVWQVQLSILNEIDTLCKDNKLEYYLAYGSLLGAVRHKGFIPWDDDLDIMMPRKDYDELKKMCIAGMLGEEFFYQDYSTEKKYYLTYAKIRKNNTVFGERDIKNIDVHKGIFVDIFPLDSVNNIQKPFFKLKANLLRNLSHVIFMKENDVAAVSAFNKLMDILLKPFSSRQLIKLYNVFIGKKQEGDYYVFWDHNKTIYLKSWFEKSVDLEFCHQYFKAPKEYNKVLKKSYGNYMRIPDLEEREDHSVEYVLFDLDNNNKKG